MHDELTDKTDMFDALFVNQFGMKGVIVKDENNKMMLLCYPTGTTERR